MPSNTDVARTDTTADANAHDDDGDADSEKALLVSLLDGTVRAVNRDTGEMIWSFSSGGPLMEAHAGDGESDDDDDGDSEGHGDSEGEGDGDGDGDAVKSSSNRPRQLARVFPGVDGSLYTISRGGRGGRGGKGGGGGRHGVDGSVTRDGDGSGGSHSRAGTGERGRGSGGSGGREAGRSGLSTSPSAQVTKLPVTARQLVEASPSMTRDGAVVIGTRKSTVFALDPRLGTLLRTFSTDGTVVHGGDEALFRPPDVQEGGPALRRAIFLGRTDYLVRSVDWMTGRERWNVTCGKLRPLTRAG
jgi:outer membrane protein assembly factor BamB